jgi:3-phosphoglycerate kinase
MYSKKEIMTSKLSIEDLDLKGKKALIRVDFNVPIEKGVITDDTRIKAVLPTLQYVLDHGGAAILMSHLGRPKGAPDPQYSLAPCAKRLAQLLAIPVQLAPDCHGPEVAKMAKELRPGEVLLLENLRFHPGEEKPEKEPAFVSGLAELGDLYINDAFGTAHRAHASTTTIAQFFPHKAAAGFLMQKELDYLSSVLSSPKRPFCSILGGAKISTKFKVIESLLQKADILLVGGAMAFTFFKAENIPVGDSIYENDFIPVARQLMDLDVQSRCRILLPSDIVIARSRSPNAERRIVNIRDGIPDGFQGLDIGPQTIQTYSREIRQAETVFWNGPLGVFECPPFDQGTNAIAQILSDLKGATTIVGGGETVAAVEKGGYKEKITHLSTGGGAALEYIESGRLPGIDALSDRVKKE